MLILLHLTPSKSVTLKKSGLSSDIPVDAVICKIRDFVRYWGGEPALVQELIEYRLSNPVPPQQYQAQLAAGIGMSALTDSQVEQRMNAVYVPALIMTGDSDMVVPPGNAEMLEAKIMKAQKVIIPASGHIFPIENPAATVKEIQRFLSE